MKKPKSYIVIDPYKRKVYAVTDAQSVESIIGCANLGWWTENNTIFWCDDIGLMKPALPTFHIMKGNAESSPIAGRVVVEGGRVTLEKIQARVRWSPLTTDAFELERKIEGNVISTTVKLKEKE